MAELWKHFLRTLTMNCRDALNPQNGMPSVNRRGDISAMTECVTDNNNFPGNKPWITSDLKKLLSIKKKAWREHAFPLLPAIQTSHPTCTHSLPVTPPKKSLSTSVMAFNTASPTSPPTTGQIETSFASTFSLSVCSSHESAQGCTFRWCQPQGPKDAV